MFRQKWKQISSYTVLNLDGSGSCAPILENLSSIRILSYTYGPDPPPLGLKAMYLLSLPKWYLSFPPLWYTGIFYVLFLRQNFCLNFVIFTFHTYILDFVLSCLSSTLENLVFIRLSYAPGICGFAYFSAHLVNGLSSTPLMSGVDGHVYCSFFYFL